MKTITTVTMHELEIAAYIYAKLARHTLNSTSVRIVDNVSSVPLILAGSADTMVADDFRLDLIQLAKCTESLTVAESLALGDAISWLASYPQYLNCPD